MHESTHTVEQAPQGDKIEVLLKNIAQNIIAVVFGLLPLFFIPVAYAPFDYSKILLVLVGVLVAIIVFSLSVLRSGTIQVKAPAALLGLWGIVITAAISGLLSGDMHDSFVGNIMGVHTVAFLLLLALVATVITLFGQSKASIMRLYFLLTASALVLTLFHIVRLFFGPGVFSFGIFKGSVSTPIGGWNDLGLLFGLIILLALVALEQLPLTKWGKIVFSGAVGLSLLMLAVVNFFAIWIVLALVSLVVLMYGLTKDRFAQQSITRQAESSVSMPSIILSASVFIVSLIFIIGGSTIGTFVSNITNISYVEVRPSLEATVDIGKSVYKENAFVGIGPNKFVDAWRLYKDPSINQTIFWNTDFNAGNGYIPTMFVTTGIFGALAWIIFLLLILRAGYKMLFATQAGDKFWYFIGSSSFVAATYLWGMSLVYVSGTTTLLLAGLFTGILFASYIALVPTKSLALSVASNKRSGFILVGLVMLVIICASSALYYSGRHYASVYSFSEAVNSVGVGANIETIEAKIAAAYAVSKNDVYARQIAQYQLAKMNSLITLTDPTPEQQQQFQAAAANGINAAQLAITTDSTDALNYTVLGNIYGILAIAGVEGSKELAQESFEKARQYNPTNPIYPLLNAQLLARTGDLDAAYERALESVKLKSNYTEALSLLTQIDIAQGNVDKAVQTSQAMISLEPKNPARYYQLGVLLSSQEKFEQSIVAFERAVQLDANYANARYFLALAYEQVGRSEDAIVQLEIVRDLNPDNAGVEDVISQIKSGVPLTTPTAEASSVTEPEGVSVGESNNAVITTEDPDTSLISPVNVVPDGEDAETESVTSEGEGSETDTTVE